MRKTLILAAAILGLFCFEAKAERTVHAIVPIHANNKGNHDSVVTIFLSNPSAVPQNVSLDLSATGQLYFQTAGGYPVATIGGTNLYSCSNSQTCSMQPQFRVLQPGENRTLRMRVRRNGSGSYPANQGVRVSIQVAENDGYVLAAGYSFIEHYDAIAYSGGPFTINGGRPF